MFFRWFLCFCACVCVLYYLSSYVFFLDVSASFSNYLYIFVDALVLLCANTCFSNLLLVFCMRSCFDVFCQHRCFLETFVYVFPIDSFYLGCGLCFHLFCQLFCFMCFHMGFVFSGCVRVFIYFVNSCVFSNAFQMGSVLFPCVCDFIVLGP